MSVVSLTELEDWVRRFARLCDDNRDLLTELDSAIGDADHGINMARGMTAVVARLDEQPPDTVDALFKTVGMTLVSTVGGASGPLYGTFFLRFGMSSGEVDHLDGPGLARSMRAAVEGVVARGKAELGDKTMVDALSPAADALATQIEDGFDIPTAMTTAAEAASAGSDATIPLIARKGRASYLGERSAGHRDPGAASSALLMQAAAAAMG